MKQKPTIQKVLEEFDENYAEGFCGNCENTDCREYTKKHLRSFLLEAISTVLEEVKDRIPAERSVEKPGESEYEKGVLVGTVAGHNSMVRFMHALITHKLEEGK